MADERTYTAVEHQAILETAVARATADLKVAREDLESEKSGLQTTIVGLQNEKAELLARVDKAEAEKAAAEKAKADVDAEFAEYKAAIERKEEIAKLKAERSEKAKAELAGLDEKYFTEERIARWAEMSPEQFETAIADLRETAGAIRKPEDKAAEDKKAAEDAEKAARETAAFKGGAEISTDANSTFMQLMAAKRSA